MDTNLTQLKEKFKAYLARMDAYNHALGVMSFDEETIMPRGGSEDRGAAMGVLAEVSYNLSVSDELREMLAGLAARRDELDHVTCREVEELQENLEKMARVPVEEFVAFSIARNAASNAWREAKQTNNYALFAPHLQKMIDYTQKMAAWQKPGMSTYDALLDDYERGLNTETVDRFFEAVRARVAPLIQRVTEAKQIEAGFLTRSFPVHLQQKFSDYLMDTLCIDRKYCAITETEHPFTTNFSKHDVRITTHYYENAVVSSLFSVVHEGGHALYELNTSDELLGSPLAGGVSMGVHECQSRFFENVIGRSRPYAALILQKLRELFPEQMADVDNELFYLAINRSEPSLVRTEADELTYSIHILIRYQLEKRIFAGELTVDELPAAWNALYKEYLGVDVPDDASGILQDTHWSGAMFGYFPSYAIGSAYAAQLLHKMEQDIPVWQYVAEGNLQPVIDWLTERIYRFGSLKRPLAMMEEAFGEPFDPSYYTDYLTKKYSDIYKL